MWDQELRYLIAAVGSRRGLVTRYDALLDSHANGLDQSRLFTLARAHKVVTELVMHMRAEPRAIDSPIAERVRDHARKFSAHRSLLLREWGRIVDALGSVGIPVLSVKGPALALQVYDDPQARDFRDLDFVVDAPDAETIVAALTSLGYRVHEAYDWFVHLGASRWVSDENRHIAFASESGSCIVEIHDWRSLARAGDLHDTFAALRDRAKTVAFDGREFVTLSVPDHALFQLTHGIKHACCLLRWVIDIALTLSACSPADLETVRTLLVSSDLRRVALASLTVVGQLYPEVAPSIILPSRMPPVPALRSVTATCLSCLGRASDDYSRARRLIWFELGLAETPAARVNVFASRLAAKPVDTAAIRVPERVAFLYVFIRPFLVVARAARRISSAFKRGHRAA